MKSFLQILQEAFGQDQSNANYIITDLNGKMVHNAPIKRLGEWYQKRKNFLPKITKKTLFGEKEISEPFDPSRYKFFIFDPGAKLGNKDIKNFDGYSYKQISWSELVQKYKKAKELNNS
jgi:hypothetical protein